MTFTVRVDGGIHFIEHRRYGIFANFEDVLNGVDAVLAGATEAGHDTYALDMFRKMLVESAALRKDA